MGEKAHDWDLGICNLARLKITAQRYAQEWSGMYIDPPTVMGLIEVAYAARDLLDDFDTPHGAKTKRLRAAVALFNYGDEA